MARKHAGHPASGAVGPARSGTVFRRAARASLWLGADGRVDAEVGFDGVAFGVENVEGVGGADGEAEVVELHVAAAVAVHAADVDGELLIDKHPDVVVAGECEGLAAAVLKCGVDLGREVEVVLP